TARGVWQKLPQTTKSWRDLLPASQRTSTPARCTARSHLRRLILGVEEHLDTGALVVTHSSDALTAKEALMSLVNPRAVPPYPPQRYTRDEAEVSAWLRRGTDPPDYDSFGLVQYHYLANQKATDGDYGLYRVEIAPNGGGPGPHFHR